MIGPTTVPGIALQVAGVALSIDAIRQVLPAMRSRRWQAVRGRILASKPQSSPAQIQWGRGHALTWDPGVVYEYTVDGATYRSQRVSFGGHWPSASAAQRIADRFRVGERVTVWHDPVLHDQAVLERGASAGNWVELTAGVVLLLIGLIVSAA
jgi:hypothetical protein